jgi:hypothetical protein
MSLATLRPKTQLTLAIALPIVCLILGVALIWPYTSRLRQADRELQQTQSTIQKKKQVISQVELAARGHSLALAVVLPSEEEPIVFLRQLAALTAESGASIDSVRSVSPPPMPGASGSPAGSPPVPAGQQASASSAPANLGQGQRPVIPSTVQELANEIAVEGRFGDILALIVRLENFERILSVSKCQIKSAGAQSYPKLRATFLVSRFVAAPESPTPAGQPAPAGQAQPTTAAP